MLPVLQSVTTLLLPLVSPTLEMKAVCVGTTRPQQLQRLFHAEGDDDDDDDASTPKLCCRKLLWAKEIWNKSNNNIIRKDDDDDTDKAFILEQIIIIVVDVCNLFCTSSKGFNEDENNKSTSV